MITKFRTYRDKIAADGVQPLSFIEWILGRAAGRLEVWAATMAKKRGDNTTLNHTLLVMWAGNQRSRAHLVASLPPAELSQAIKDGRLRLVLDPYRSPQA
jgi:hypothetical protein